MKYVESRIIRSRGKQRICWMKVNVLCSELVQSHAIAIYISKGCQYVTLTALACDPKTLYGIVDKSKSNLKYRAKNEYQLLPFWQIKIWVLTMKLFHLRHQR